MSSEDVSQKLNDLSFADAGSDMTPAGKMPAGPKTKAQPTSSSKARPKAPAAAIPPAASPATPSATTSKTTVSSGHVGRTTNKPATPALTCGRVKEAASAPDSVLAVVLARLCPDDLARVHALFGHIIKSIHETDTEDDLVLKAKRRKELPESENLKRRLALLQSDVAVLQQKLAQDGVLRMDLSFTLCHDYTDFSVKDCISLTAKLDRIGREAQTIGILARVELGKVLMHVRDSGGDFVSTFFKATGYGSESAYRHIYVADLCLSYPMLPFLRNASWSWMGQHQRQLREFIAQQDDDFQAFLSQPPPTIAETTIMIEKQPVDEHSDVNPFDGASHVPDETLDASDFDWSNEAHVVRVDGDCDQVVRARLRMARLM